MANLNDLPQRFIILINHEEHLVIKSSLSLDNDSSKEPIEKIPLVNFLNSLENANIIKNYCHIVTNLNLSYCDLTETPGNWNWPYLKHLNLSHNNLKTIPPCLYDGLNNLESLDLSYNLLENFDLEPNCVKTLQKLILDCNNFKSLPSWFLNFQCKNLKELSYCNNKATDYKFLDHICNFSIMKLEKMELINACLVDIDFKWIKLFKKLNYLDISNKQLFGGKFANKIDNLDALFQKPRWIELKVLKLNFLDIAFYPEGLFWMESLKELHINNNLISWFPDEGIEYLINLEYLDISCNSLVALPEKLNHLTHLKTIIAYKNHLDDIPLLPNSLECFDLYDNFLKDFKNELINDIELIDLDYNYVDLIERDFDYKQYNKKRKNLRLKFNFEDRGDDCIKTVQEEDYEKYYGDLSDEEYDCVENPNPVGTNNIENFEKEEDWDRGYDSDDAWNGEDTWANCWSYKPVNSNLYVDDEDWMFEDAD